MSVAAAIMFKKGLFELVLISIVVSVLYLYSIYGRVLSVVVFGWMCVVSVSSKISEIVTARCR